jgi:hypothetical protein
MPYSNRKRHNPPSIPQTPYQPLIIRCPNFDPIYQVILLENLNEWNLFPAKRMILKKRREQWLKNKRGETSYEELHVTKREREDEIYKLLGDILSKEIKEITFSYSAKFDVWRHPYPHIICICTTFYSLTFSFLTPIHYTIFHQPWLFATQIL